MAGAGPVGGKQRRLQPSGDLRWFKKLKDERPRARRGGRGKQLKGEKNPFCSIDNPQTEDEKGKRKRCQTKWTRKSKKRSDVGESSFQVAKEHEPGETRVTVTLTTPEQGGGKGGEAAKGAGVLKEA